MKKITLIILIFLFTVSLFSSIPQIAQAQVCPPEMSGGLVPCAKDCDDPNTPYNETQDCQICHFFVMLDTILDFIILTLVPVVAVLMLVIGGLLFFFAGASPQRLEQAKSIITSVVIGLVIIFAAWLIISTFFVIIGVAGTDFGRGVSDWFTIECPILVP